MSEDPPAKLSRFWMGSVRLTRRRGRLLAIVPAGAACAAAAIVVPMLTSSPSPSSPELIAPLGGCGCYGVSSVAFSPSGTTLAIARGYGDIYLWNIRGRDVAATLTDPNSNGGTSVLFSPSGTTLASADYNATKYGRHPHRPQKRRRDLDRIQPLRHIGHRRLQRNHLPVERLHQEADRRPHRPRRRFHSCDRIQPVRHHAGHRR
jgi:hypothetical protein